MEKNTDKYCNSNLSGELISISPLDLINFVRNFWKIICVSSLAGLCLGVVYITVIPPQFEAVGLFRIAQIQSKQPTTNQSNNLEEPAVLIYKLKNPNFYGDKEFQACGVGGLNKLGDQVIGMMSVTTFAGNNSIIKLNVLGSSPSQSVACAHAIFEAIKKSQDNALSGEYLEANRLLNYYQAKLDDTKDFMKNPPKGDISQSISYLVARDEAQFALREVERIRQSIRSIEEGSSRLISPFYASDTQVFPKKKLILFIATLIGLLFGCTFALLQKKRVINFPHFFF